MAKDLFRKGSSQTNNQRSYNRQAIDIQYAKHYTNHYSYSEARRKQWRCGDKGIIHNNACSLNM